MLPVYGKLVPGEGMWVFKRVLWRKFNQFSLKHLILETVNLSLLRCPFERQFFKRVSLFLPVFQSRNSDKAGLCWQGEKVRVKMNVGGIIEWTV